MNGFNLDKNQRKCKVLFSLVSRPYGNDRRPEVRRTTAGLKCANMTFSTVSKRRSACLVLFLLNFNPPTLVSNFSLQRTFLLSLFCNIRQIDFFCLLRKCDIVWSTWLLFFKNGSCWIVLSFRIFVMKLIYNKPPQIIKQKHKGNDCDRM